MLSLFGVNVLYNLGEAAMADYEQSEKHESRSNLSNIAWTASMLASMTLPMFDRTEVKASDVAPAPITRTADPLPMPQQTDLLNIQYAPLSGLIPAAMRTESKT